MYALIFWRDGERGMNWFVWVWGVGFSWIKRRSKRRTWTRSVLCWVTLKVNGAKELSCCETVQSVLCLVILKR